MLSTEDKIQRWSIVILTVALLLLVFSMAGCRPEHQQPADPHSSVPGKQSCRWSNGERADCVSGG